MNTAAPTQGFAHLHVHSEYSALDGLIRIGDAFEIAGQHGETALAITDHGTLGGLWKAQYAAEENGVKAIPGCEVYLAFGDRKLNNSEEIAADDDSDDSDSADGDGGSRKKVKKYQHLVLIARNAAGWRNLVRINNKAEETKWGKYPRIDYALLAEHSEGIIVLTGCLGGPVLGPLSRGDGAKAEEGLLALIDAVGRENVYLEIMEHGIAAESRILPEAAALAAKHGIPLVATNDAHYSRAEDAPTHAAWLALRSGTVLSDPKRYRFHGDGFHLRTEAEMRALRPEDWWQQAVSNTMLVADRVERRVLPMPSPKLPVFPTPAGFADNTGYYMHLVRAGAEEIYGSPLPALVRDRLNVERAVIKSTGFVDYFLIVHEVIAWARENDILVGPGRGSAAGSLTAYCLHITGLDPLENDLLFERFLEPGRSDFPDIDVDFERSRREDVLDHLAEKWGKDNVALIGSFGASKSKRALKDAARVIGLSGIGAKLAKLVPVEQGAPAMFRDLMDESVGSGDAFRKELARLGEDGRKVVALARGFDEAINGVSIHACGVVISDRDLTDIVPLRIHPKTGRHITAWDSKDSEKFGMLKLDVLALRNLDIVRQAVRYIKETTGEDVDVDRVPHPDTKGDPRVDAAWALLQAGRTAGIFQMESVKMTALARQVRPDNLADLSAVIALHRPGPLSAGMDQHFAMRKSGAEAVDYGIYTADPAEQAAIASVLGSTHGVFIFQEQIMRLGTVVAGFDAAGRSDLRRAVGKKDKVKMAAVGEEFRAGATTEFRDAAGNVISPVFRQATADRLWEMIKGSGSYLFNASHSAAYAQLAYITAYLKANWPGSYGAAILTMTHDAEKRTEALRALPEEGIEILPPDVNLSRAHSAPEGTARVRLGLSEIKDVGAAGTRIVEERDTSRPFESFYDMVNRVRRVGLEDDNEPDTGYLPANQIAALIDAGAFDAFGPRKGLAQIARIVKEAPDLAVPLTEYGIIERSSRQRGRLLVSIGEHPLKHFQDQVRAWNRPGPPDPNGNPFRAPATPIGRLPMEDGASVTTIGLLSRFSEGSYRGGRKANISLEGSNSVIDGIMWDRTLTEAKDSGTIPPLGGVVAVSGRITLREFEQEDEDGEITIAQLREITVGNVFPVGIDDPDTPAPVVSCPIVPVFTLPGCDPHPQPEPAAAHAEAPAVAPTTVERVAGSVHLTLPKGSSLNWMALALGPERYSREIEDAVRNKRTSPPMPSARPAIGVYALLGSSGEQLGDVTVV